MKKPNHKRLNTRSEPLNFSRKKQMNEKQDVKPVRFKIRKTKKMRFAVTNNCQHPFVKQSGKKLNLKMESECTLIRVVGIDKCKVSVFKTNLKSNTLFSFVFNSMIAKRSLFNFLLHCLPLQLLIIHF